MQLPGVGTLKLSFIPAVLMGRQPPISLFCSDFYRQLPILFGNRTPTLMQAEGDTYMRQGAD